MTSFFTKKGTGLTLMLNVVRYMRLAVYLELRCKPSPWSNPAIIDRFFSINEVHYNKTATTRTPSHDSLHRQLGAYTSEIAFLSLSRS